MLVTESCWLLEFTAAAAAAAAATLQRRQYVRGDTTLASSLSALTRGETTIASSFVSANERIDFATKSEHKKPHRAVVYIIPCVFSC